MKLIGNPVLITSGGSGIGRELTRRHHDGGNAVIVARRRQRALDETIEGRAGMTSAVLDIEDADAIAAFAHRVVAEYPALNVLVNNAGIVRIEDLSGPRDLAGAEATVATNLLGPIRMTDRLVGHLVAQADAAIVNVSSRACLRAGGRHADLFGDQGDAALLHGVPARAAARPGRGDRAGAAGGATDLTPGQSMRDGYLPFDLSSTRQ